VKAAGAEERNRPWLIRTVLNKAAPPVLRYSERCGRLRLSLAHLALTRLRS